MKLHRDLKVTQKTAWFMQQRIREAWAGEADAIMAGPMEVDETYFGGRRKNMSKAKRRDLKGRARSGRSWSPGPRIGRPTASPRKSFVTLTGPH